MAKSYEHILYKHINLLERILKETNINTPAEYMERLSKDDEMFKAATTFHLGHIGEAVKNLDESLKNLDSSIRWFAIGRLRNIAFHDYDSVNYKVVSDLMFKDIPKVKALITPIVNLDAQSDL